MSQTGMLQRCWEHDYCAPSFYMVTLVTEPRRDCLSEVGADAALRLLPMGEVVQDAWARTSDVYEGVEACECVVMPDHFHGLLWVKEPQPRHMGHIVKAFKRVSRGECRSKGLLLPPDKSRKGLLLPPDKSRRGLREQSLPAASSVSAAASSVSAAASSVSAAASAAEVMSTAIHSTLWQDGYQDSILLRKGQLKAMAQYIADNPRRLATKRAKPELFTVVTAQQVTPARACPAIGNRYLLERPVKRQVQISRSISAAALAEKRAALLYAAEHGAVLVSPCISPGEKEIARAALEAGLPLIVLVENGFSPLYKPSGRYFDACAAGHLLILAPFPYHRDRRTITRQQCQTLNAWATAIVEGSEEDATHDTEIHAAYHDAMSRGPERTGTT